MPSTIQKLAIDEAVADLLNKTLKLEGFFPEFKKEHLEKVFLRSGYYFYPKGTRVLEQGTTGRDLYIVMHGRLAVYRNEGTVNRRVGSLKDGDVFAEIGLLNDGLRVATVEAEDDSRLFRLVYADIQYLLDNNKELGMHLTALAQKRLKS